MPRLSAGKGAGEGAAGAGAGCGGLQCARWTHEGSKTLREKRVGFVTTRRGGRGLVTKGTPTRGSSQARGGSRAAAWEAQKMLRERSGTLPALGRTHLRPLLGPGLTPGLPRVCFACLRLRVVGMGLCPRP